MNETESASEGQTVETVADSGKDARRAAGTAPHGIRRGDAIGRYQVRSLLGAGGMGQVFTALDPELGRTVALKLVLRDGRAPSSRERARLLREAQALAKLQHPNVVAIHDVGTQGDQVFIAMELITGDTLGAWLASSARPWRAIIAVFVAAGRGLAAAHAGGIVHRDFKPSNVVVGTDRVVVVDFGLACARGDEAAREDSGGMSSPPSVFDVSLTLTGERVGTLRYMAPEQHTGGLVSPLTDQFAFAAALWEALYGVAPFPGVSSAEVLRKMKSGPAVPPSARTVPERVRAALARALAVEPERRWPCLDDLLAALQPTPARRGRSLVLAGLAMGLVAVAFVGGRKQAAAPSCGAGAAIAKEVWSAAARARVQTAFRATGQPYADGVFQRVDAAMTAKLDAWARAHRDSCEATHVRHEQSDALLDLRTRCLGRARAEIETLVTLLADTSKAGIDHALVAIGEAGDTASCSDVTAMTAVLLPPTDPDLARQVAELERERARVVAVDHLGRAKEAVAGGRALLERARRLGYAPILAEVLNTVTGIEADYGDAARLPELIHEQLRVAQETHNDRLVAIALGDEASDVGVRHERFSEGASLFRIAEAALLRAGDVPHEAFAIMYDEGNFLAAQSQSSFALSRYALALAALCSRGDCVNHPKLPFVLQAIAGEEAHLGETPRARALMERALVLLERTRRKEDPLIAAVLCNLGVMEIQAGNVEEAIASYQRALPLAEAGLGADHPSVALVLTNLAEALTARRHYTEARERAERALRIREDKLGHDSPALVPTLKALAVIALGEGKLAEALALVERSLTIGKAAFGADSEELIESYEVLAGVDLARGLPAAAGAAAERALELQEKSASKTDVGLAKDLRLRARCLAAQRRAPQALAALDRALTLDPTPSDAEALVGDAEVLLAAGQPARAVPIAERAVAALAAPERRKPGILDTRARRVLASAVSNAASRERRRTPVHEARGHSEAEAEAPAPWPR